MMREWRMYKLNEAFLSHRGRWGRIVWEMVAEMQSLTLRTIKSVTMWRVDNIEDEEGVEEK